MTYLCFGSSVQRYEPQLARHRWLGQFRPRPLRQADRHSSPADVLWKDRNPPGWLDLFPTLTAPRASTLHLAENCATRVMTFLLTFADAELWDMVPVTRNYYQLEDLIDKR